MFSFYQRISTVFSFCSSCLMLGLAIIAMTSYFLQKSTPDAKIRVDNVSLRRGHEDYYLSTTQWLADLRLGLEVDFRPLFHWNTKQLFLYLVYEYKTIGHDRNEIVVWDRILQSSDANKRIDLDGFKSKYSIADPSGELIGSSGKLKLYWNTVPQVGWLFDTQSGQTDLNIEDPVVKRNKEIDEARKIKLAAEQAEKEKESINNPSPPPTSTDPSSTFTSSTQAKETNENSNDEKEDL